MQSQNDNDGLRGVLQNLLTSPHRRYNPLSNEWVLVSPHRLQRPWQGKVEATASDNRPVFDPKCYLCPGNERAGGARNPVYDSVYVFQNDFAALLPSGDHVQIDEAALLRAESETGLCRVVCFAPEHNRTLPEMTHEEIGRVIETWTAQYLELASRQDIAHVQIFENKGAIMGCSNPHPHGQIWATASIPHEPAREDAAQSGYLHQQGKCLLCSYAELERSKGDRIVCANESWMALVPFWAKWPFETMLLPTSHARHLGELSTKQQTDLADIMKRLLTRYDNLFEVSFPYTMGWHQLPDPADDASHWHLHAHFYPPLLRSAVVQKFMVGFEMLANPQRDITPELAAAQLRDLSEIHYKQTK